MLKAEYIKHKLVFKIPGGTSRGILKTKDSWYLKVFNDDNPHIVGFGEASIIPKLSIDDRPDFEEKLKWVCKNINTLHPSSIELNEFPSIRFALETALLDLYNGGRKMLFDNSFSRGEKGIYINGLIWMGSYEFMRQQIIDKIENGFRCIKLKIGAIDFDKELSLLSKIRKDFTSGELELRVDANGAFKPNNALEKLKKLSEFEIHSIEQPIKAGQWEAMANLTTETPFPIALDEELIGLSEDKIASMLDQIKPQYIILKPSLLGGFEASENFIHEAEKRDIGWWVTSALEANIGLNAISQWTNSLKNKMPQGLGTGKLFINNLNSPLQIIDARLWYNKNKTWDNIEDTIKINDTLFFRQSLMDYSHEKINNNETEEWEKDIFRFILEWFNKDDFISVKTSGSTGKPKEIKLKKEHVKISAKKTIDFFGLKPDDTALLCLPANYIAGKLMIVRAIEGKLNLKYTKPEFYLKTETSTVFDFVALTPSMLAKITEKGDIKSIDKFRKILLGGTQIPSNIENFLQKAEAECWHSYGMTETITHIALRKVNTKEKSDFFTPLKGINLSVNKQNLLKISYPEIGITNLLTNDIVRLNENQKFKISGRADNVINSGGMKIFPEELEKKLMPYLQSDFYFTSENDIELGSKLVLVVGKNTSLKEEEIRQITESVFEPKLRPKKIILAVEIEKTQSGKIIRKKF